MSLRSKKSAISTIFNKETSGSRHCIKIVYRIADAIIVDKKMSMPKIRKTIDIKQIFF